MPNTLRFRQVHLDFHTSGAIAGLAERFDKKTYQRTLKRAAVNSITTFATCHHGWSYYNTKVGKRHPGLSFDLLRTQFDACKEIGVNVPIYLTAGVHNMMAEAHPEWREINPEGRLAGWSQSNLQPGFKTMSFHSPYLDYLCEQVAEVVRMFPDADGIFLDIINQVEDCSKWALEYMQAQGLDPLNQEDRRQSRVDAMMKYYKRVTQTIRDIDPNMPVFHNSGHVTPGLRKVFPYFSHLELESLPTGGWGYDHFPLSAKYAHKLDMEYLGMTGKFHSTWGEFGGYKHPNALRYECCAMLAYGAKCSVGDQLHPVGALDESTYEIIGEAYREVAEKEAFAEGARNVADVAILSSAAAQAEKAYREDSQEFPADTGAARVLLEEHILFDVIDTEMDFDVYRMIVLPDTVSIGSELEAKLKAYLASGGKLFLTGDSGLSPQGEMLFDVGGTVGEPSEFTPDYVLPIETLRPDFVAKPMVMYKRSRRLSVSDGESLGEVYDPYFNRTWEHFCSHQHAPAQPEASGFACGVHKGNILYLAHPVFSTYRTYGQVALREYIGKSLRKLLSEGERIGLRNLPSTGRVTLMHQAAEKRYVLHLLHANTINRGGEIQLHGGNQSGPQKSYEVIEDFLPLHDIEVEVKVDEPLTRVQLEPEGTPVDYTAKDGVVQFTVDRMLHHQMVSLSY